MITEVQIKKRITKQKVKVIESGAKSLVKP